MLKPPHADNCVSKACRGCGHNSEKGKLEIALSKEQQRNATLLEELRKVRKELNNAQAPREVCGDGSDCL